MISTPLTCNPVKLLFDDSQGFVARKHHKKSQKAFESEAHFPYCSAYSGLTNVLCIPDVIKKTTVCKET